MTDEEQAVYESYRWEDLLELLIHVMNEVDEKRDDSIRETRNILSPEYDRLEEMLWHVRNYVEGRIEELHPGYCEGQNFGRFSFRSDKEAMRYALQEGINYVALSALAFTDRIPAIEYISENRLSSLNYEKACLAVEEYRTARREMKRWA